MSELDIILICCAAVILIASVAIILILQSRSARRREELISSFKKERDSLVEDYEKQKDSLQERITSIGMDKAALESRIVAMEEYETRSKNEAEKAGKETEERHKRELEQMKEVFKNLTSDSSTEFRTKSSQAIADILKPLQEKMQEFSAAVKENEKNSVDRHGRLEQKIADLSQESKSVGDEARNLADALMGHSKVQGNFGEMILTDLLVNAGLQQGVHFVTQGYMRDSEGREILSDDGKRMIPDVQILYPDGTCVIVDSKVSLKDYSDYLAAKDIEARKNAAKAHVNSVLSHVNELKDKDYASYLDEGRRKVGYNIMFIPMEGAFRLLLEEDPLLWQRAKDNGVLIVSQMTLVIVLNMIQMTWRQYEQQQNIAKVYQTAGELLSKIEDWLSAYEGIGESLQQAQKSYDEATKALKSSDRSVIKKIGKLQELGITPKKRKTKLKKGGDALAPLTVIPKSLSAEDDEPSEE
ncbi:MAG: DNA recombination protein RmuC [Bacteroidales bacterium]|nr:DNA recombination protein RmuC [Bacteroidales bacterium]